MNFSKTQKIVYVSLLTALQVVLTRFLGIQTPIVQINFSFFPLALVGILFGPGYALVSGALADFLGAVLFPYGAYFPGFTLSAALTGLVYGLFLYQKPKKFWRVCIAVLIINIVISLGLSTYWVHMINGKAFIALLPTRIAQNLLMIPIKIILIWFAAYQIVPIINKGKLQGKKNTA